MPFRLLVRALRAALVVALRRARGRPLHPRWSFELELVVQLLRDLARWWGTLPPPELRRAAGAVTEPLPRGVQTRAEVRAGVPLTWFIPPEADADALLLFVHGGGYVFGSAAQERRLIGRLALRTRRRVLAPDYRLAPEHPCPAAVDDLDRVYHALLEQGVAPRRIACVGVSAGGGLVLAALQRWRDAGAALPAAAALLSPLVDLRASAPSWTRHEQTDWGTRELVLKWNRMYAGGLPLDDPRVSPALGALGGLPPLLVVAGGAELLLDDARDLVSAARAAGVDAELLVGADMVHGYHAFGDRTPRAGEALEAIAALVTGGR